MPCLKQFFTHQEKETQIARYIEGYQNLPETEADLFPLLPTQLAVLGEF